MAIGYPPNTANEFNDSLALFQTLHKINSKQFQFLAWMTLLPLSKINLFSQNYKVRIGSFYNTWNEIGKQMIHAGTVDRALVDFNVHFFSDMVHLALWFNQIAKWTRSLILKQMWIFYFAVTKAGKEFDAIWQEIKKITQPEFLFFLLSDRSSYLAIWLNQSAKWIRTVT